MADPGMLSLFGDDANLFSDELEGLGDCGFPQGQPNPIGQQEHQGYRSLSSNSLHHPSQAGPGQPKMGHPYDPFAGYEQQQGNGPAVNGMVTPHSRYHNSPQQPGGGHHPNMVHLSNLSHTSLSHASLSHASLSHASLSHASLSHASLSHASLSHASLSHASLSHASLSHASLSHASLSHASLSHASLSHASLSHASLSHASLSHASLSHASLSHASLSHASLSHASLSHASLSHASLSHASLSHASLSRLSLTRLSLTRLSHTPLSHASLSHASLSHASLSHASLSHASLSHASLSHASLSHASLSHASLSHASLSHASLSHASLSHASLSHASLSHASLSHASLSHASLSHASLSHASLSHASLSHASLSHASLSHASLSHASLSHASLSHASLSHASLSHASLSHASLSHASLSHASLSHASLSHASLSHASLSHASLSHASLSHASLSHASLSHASLSHASLSHASLSHASLSHASLSHASLSHASLSHASLSHASLSHASLSHASLSHASLSHASLSHASLSHASLSHASLSHASLSHASLSHASLSHASLSHASLSHASLSHASLSHASLSHASLSHASLSHASLSHASLSHASLSHLIVYMYVMVCVPPLSLCSSYLHCRWADLEELEKDKRIHQKVKRFRAKQALPTFVTEMDDEPFNPDYVEVDRVLDVSESTDENGEPVKLYLVKWCSLPYEDITWELKADIDQAKIDEYEAVAARQPETKRVERPPTENWQKSESSRDYKNDNALRDYQLEGVNWLLFNWYNTRNCILADEMGLGKTIQSITFLYEIYLKGIHGPFLVIAPLSTIPNWEREFRTWTELNVIVYHGSQASRKTIQAYEMNYRDVQGRVIKGAYKFHAVITTFEMILTDCPELRSVSWRCVVIDEAHRLKNRNCKLLEGLKMMDMEHKVLLTGTPLQNTVEELFSLLNFLEPERFPSENTFMQEFGDLKTEEQVQKLQAILKPMMLRRLKEDVEKNLAPKEETIIEVELTNIQKKYYRAILEKNFSFLSKGGPGGGGGAWGGGGAQVPNLLNTMMELRKCCNHPYLINGAEEKILDDFRENHHAEMPQFHLQAMIQAAGKLVLIDKLLPKLKAGGHRVLVFSQMVRCLDILEDYLIQKRYPYERIDGRVRGNLRQAAIDRFSRPDSDRFVFLLCTRAGGLGINLTAADTCIIFDSDWNPQNDLQAQARCHRIGQSKAVKIYRLITRNSYEREMFDKASLKLGLDKAVLQSMSGRENVPQLSKKEVEDLLRKGAYGALMDEEDEGSKFCEEDIDQILLRRTQTITIESEGKGSTFAKASFVAAGNRTDISLEDPDFWQKWAKKAELDMEAINGRNTLVIDTPRVRKQTRHYSSMKEDELAEFSELESDGENEKPLTKLRRPQDRAHGYPRSECFRVEKNLLVYGWGRWGDILSRGRFKRPLQEQDVETICRALLAYCLLHYRGDENIKRFIWDLITPSEDGQSRTLTNHSGLSTPVPRGRKGKKGKPAPPAPPQLPRAEWLASCNPDLLLQEDSYKRHLKHHCNKVLLRVRMLYYLRQEVIGDHADRILEGTDSSEMDIWIPQPFHAEVPADWWDSEADKSLLIGVFKHGKPNPSASHAQPWLFQLDWCSHSDRGAQLAQEDEDPEYKPLRMTFKDEMEDFANSPLDDKDETNIAGSRGAGRLYWPAASALTARLRRLITAYQRTHKREQLRQEGGAFIPEATVLPAEGGAAFKERRQRWTRREESDFYRVVSTFGVIYDTDRQLFDWTQFRAFARLDKKSDESLEKYYFSFVAMCKRVCRMQVKLPDPTLIIDPITEERASRTLYRIELLRRIREQVLPNPLLGERLRLCQPSSDLPEWWACRRHDHDLLLGASKHGVSRTDYHILNDPALGFLEAHRKFTKGTSAGVPQPPRDGALSTASSSSTEQATATAGAEKSLPQKNFDEESNASLSTTARDETRDGFCPEEEPSAIPALQERTTSSFWPKDRVMINRMDNICDAVIKGKWPANRRQFFDFPGLLPGYPGPMTSESPMPRRSLAELSMTAQTNFSGSEDLTLSPQVNVSLSPAFPQQEDSERTKASVEGLQMPPRSHHHNIPSTSARVPSVSAMEDREAGTPSNKDLSDWLRQHPTYTMDMPTFPKPKQKRHRCRNPNKIDINTLTGEERVPVVNRRNGRKMGGAMAPPMKDLPRWLLENSDFAVAPDWTDIVKQSGFLPEAMFDRLLTGPLVREEGVRRRGRRPKSEIAKATAAASSGGLNPLLINSLFGGMDLTSLQGLQSLQSLQLQLMGFPGMGGADAKHASAMLPLMLPGMAGMGVLPNMFGLGGLFASNLAAASPAAASNGTNNEDDSDETSKRDAREGGEEQDEEKDDTGEEEESSKAIGEAAALNVAAAATASSGMSANSMAFNPFLLSTMAPGLFSPYMFLPPGLGGLTLPGFPPTALTDLQSAMAGAMGVASGAQGQEKEPNQVALDCPAAAIADPETADDSDSAESLEKTAESSALEDETSALAGEADSPEDLEEGEDALEEEEK
uniref:Chromodomain helicase DNA binding protein 7 n=1 Tax=Oncorhynchus mykiss TaxID=8022 RepID=A0A8C7V5Y7_ONCMY